jgi:hypothetical protein
MSVQLEFLLAMLIVSIIMSVVAVIRKHWNELSIFLFFAFASMLGMGFLLLK